MNIELLALIFDTSGTVMIAFAALKVHHRVLNEQKIDKDVFSSMKKEQRIGQFGIFLVLLGFVLALVDFL